METKICKTCGKELAITAFNLDRGRRRASCGSCTYKKKDKSKVQERHKAYRARMQQEGKLPYWKKRAQVSNYRAKNVYGIEDKLTGEELYKLYEDTKQCSYCAKPFESHLHAKIDHIISLVNGGTHTVDNILFCCGRCNSTKNSRDEKEFFEYIKSVYDTLSKKYN